MKIGTLIAVKVGGIHFAGRVTGKVDNPILGTVYGINVPGLISALTPAAAELVRQLIALAPQRRDELSYWITANRDAIDQGLEDLAGLLEPGGNESIAPEIENKIEQQQGWLP